MQVAPAIRVTISIMTAQSFKAHGFSGPLGPRLSRCLDSADSSFHSTGEWWIGIRIFPKRHLLGAEGSWDGPPQFVVGDWVPPFPSQRAPGQVARWLESPGHREVRIL